MGGLSLPARARALRGAVRACAAALPALAIASAGGARGERLPFQADVDLCALRAVDHGDTSLSGSVRLQLLIRADGQVYAAFTHSGKGIRDKVFEVCLASNALLWHYPEVGLDTSAPFPLSVVQGGASAGTPQSAQLPPQTFLPSAHPEVEPAELEVPRAQETLEVLESATRAERGQAALAVHEYAEAIGAFRAALEKDPRDRLALRGLAQALAESGTGPDEARAVAGRLAAAAPESVVSAEAMLRVCAAAKDDPCVFAAWKRARSAPDVAPRSRILNDELRPLVERAAIRLRATEQERASQAAAEARAETGPAAPADAGSPARVESGPAAPAADPCAAEPTPARQAFCAVKRCFDAGSAQYAEELGRASPALAPFAAGEWRFKEAGPDRLLVTRPIEGKPALGAAAERRDATFLVKLGERFSIQPVSADARALARAHNGCTGK